MCVKSRSGHVITLSGVPVLWGSKLQSEIATSTMHAEYVALSMSMRELLPVKGILAEVATAFKIEKEQIARVAQVWEDNQGALKLATGPLLRVTPQSKNFAVKLHWFREIVEKENIDIDYIKSEKQKADIFTKGLAKQEFEKKRKMIMGW